MAPAELLNDDVPVHQNLANMDGMVASNLIVRHTLVLTAVLVIEKRVVNLLLQRSEVKLVVLFGISWIGGIRMR